MRNKWITALLIASLLCCLVGCKEEVVITTGDDPLPDTAPVVDAGANTQTSEPEPEPEPEPDPDPTCITIVVADPVSAEWTDEPNNSQRMVFDCLYLRGMYRIEGELCSDVLSSWEYIGGYNWRLKLHEGILDARGNAFTAQDLVSCLSGDAVKSITAADELTVELSLANAGANALETLLRGTWLITDEARAAVTQGELPVGFGPYVVAEEQSEVVLTLSRNDARWQGGGDATGMVDADADLIKFIYEPDAALRAGYAVTGEADVVYGIDDELYQLVKDGYTDVLMLDDECVALFFNMDDEDRLMVKRPGIRDGLLLALDRNAFLISSGSVGEVADSIVPSDTVGYAPCGYPEQDVEAAEDTAYAARYRGQTLTLLCNDEYAAAAQLILEQCGAADFEIEIVTTSEDIAVAAAQTDWDIAIAAIPVVGDAAGTYAACFATGETGATWFGFWQADVLYLAKVISTQAGNNAENIALFETWLSGNTVVVGLYTPGSYCLVADTAGEYVLSDMGIIPGALQPTIPPQESAAE